MWSNAGPRASVDERDSRNIGSRDDAHTPGLAALTTLSPSRPGMLPLQATATWGGSSGSQRVVKAIGDPPSAVFTVTIEYHPIALCADYAHHDTHPARPCAPRSLGVPCDSRLGQAAEAMYHYLAHDGALLRPQSHAAPRSLGDRQQEE